MPFAPPLYLVTDRRRFPDAAPDAAFSPEEWRVLDAAIAAGVGAVQLRDKDLDGRALCARAERLLGRCRRSRVKLIINDRVDVALAVGADGVQLPGDGLPAEAARRLLGAEPAIGCSVHAAAEIARASGADFLVFGPVYDTPSKRAYGPPQGVARLAEVARATPLPVVAVGGVTPARVAELRRAGAAGVAVMGAILDADDPARVVRQFCDALRAQT
ncbi:MAG: thiamine phosphate synthase [Thermodesulfobacteriota bacterium]